MSDPLIRLFAEVLQVDEGSLDEQSSPESVEQWDSLAAMNLVAAIEETYDVELSTRQMMQMNTIARARETLKGEGADV